MRQATAIFYSRGTDVAIQQLSASSSIALADFIAGYSNSLGGDVRWTVQTLVTLLQSTLTSLDDKTTQYAAPSATGFSVTIAPAVTGGSVFLLLTPSAGYAAGTIVLPTAVDKQEVLVHCTQAVTTLTISGGTVHGGPSALTANGFFTLRYEGVIGAWYRVG